MASRPKGFGMSAELQRKRSEKYEPELDTQARAWIVAVLEEEVCAQSPGKPDAFCEEFKDGTILCRLANKLGGNVKFSTSKMAFKMMENTGNFLRWAEELGVNKTDLFQTVDLYEGQNIPQVISGIHAVGRKAYGLGKTAHALGVKEATANLREFSDEQLKEGQNIIGLQMGSNKGASQAGDHFGRPRQVAGANVYK